MSDVNTSKLKEFLASVLGRETTLQKPADTAPENTKTNFSAPSNPLDTLGQLWSTKRETKKSLDLNELLSQDNLNKLLETQNYTSALPQELMQKISGGDIKSILEAMDTIGKQAYQNALLHATSINDAISKSRYDNVQNDFQGMLQREKARQQEAIPDNQVVDEIFSFVTSKLKATKPDADEATLHSSAKEVIQLVHDALNPAKPGPDEAQSSMDFDALFSGTSSTASKT